MTKGEASNNKASLTVMHMQQLKLFKGIAS